MKRESAGSSDFRKARTRTLIQLGGLVEKSGLLPYLNISMGDDLQVDEHIKDEVETLLGLLVDAKQSMINDPEFKQLAQLKGKQSWN